MKICNLVLAPLAVMMLALPAAAQERDEGDRPRRGPERMQRLLSAFDQDGDGELNEEERQAARRAMAERFGEMRAERDRDRQRRAERPQPRARGAAGAPGRQQARAPDRPRGPRPGGPPDPDRLFERLDRDNDGQLSKEEFLRLAWMRPHMHGGPAGPPHGGGGMRAWRGPGRPAWGGFGPPRADDDRRDSPSGDARPGLRRGPEARDGDRGRETDRRGDRGRPERERRE